jgi:NTE family protein
VISYGLDIISTMMEKDDERYIRKRDYSRTVPIPTMGVRTTDFGISRKKSIELYKSGYESAAKFIKQ